MVACIYGAASDRIADTYKEQTEELGKQLALAGHQMVFGGGSSGLMGAAARGVYNNGGTVIGVVPNFMHDFEPTCDNCTKVINCETMADRKTMMENYADLFLITPGGIGTYDEFFQILTLRELGRQEKEIILFNIDGYFDMVIGLIHDGIAKGFIRAKVLDLFIECNTVEEVMNTMEELSNK